MKKTTLDLPTLLKAGLHFGHKVSKWHPTMKPYIFTQRNGIHIIDLRQTEKALKKAADFLKKSVAEGKTILFVGTKPQIKELVKKYAQEVKMPYVNERWLGGTITNFGVISRSIKRYIDLKKQKEAGEWAKYVKKEQSKLEKELNRLEKKFAGIESLAQVPDVLLLLDTKEEETALREAQTKKVPVVGLCDTNVDIEGIDYVIPGNDDSIKAVEFVLSYLTQAIKEGQKQPKSEEK